MTLENVETLLVGFGVDIISTMASHVCQLEESGVPSGHTYPSKFLMLCIS